VILRNASVGGERKALWQPPRTEVATQTPLPSPAPPPALTVDVVCEWLEQQSDEIRSVCARVLATDLAVLQEEARAEGLERGTAFAVHEVNERAGSILQALAKISEAAEKAFTLEADHLARGCTEIVAEVFQKLAGSALMSPEAILGTVMTVLQRVRSEREVTIRVSPSDLPLLQTHQSAFDKVLAPRRWTITGDSRVSAGGCLIESTLGTLDGRLAVQLAKVSDTLRAARAARLEAQ
jgi:flagellar biosynthesis/type III secretory pathway protein FliH